MDHRRKDEGISADAQAALNVPETPAYVFSESVLRSTASYASSLAARAGCRLLYTLKPCGLAGVLQTLSPYVHGFAASSIFEVRLASEFASTEQSLHCYSPGFSAAELSNVMSSADYVSLNSLIQLEMAKSMGDSAASLGLRVNPEMRFAADSRYDPCRPYSKLGVPISDLRKLPSSPGVSLHIEGIHVHNNCESDDFTQLEATVESIQDILHTLDELTWVNLGGGYYLDPEVDAAPLARAVRLLTQQFGLAVFIEPGTAMVQQAGVLVSEVLDVFESGGKSIAVIDASTSHMPEVFEYGFAPSVSGPVDGGDNVTIIAGKTCLAGDTLGEYSFQEPLRVGDRVAILDAGSYSHSRSAPFNGIPIPSSYLMREDGSFRQMTGYEYGEFAARNGMVAVAPA